MLYLFLWFAETRKGPKICGQILTAFLLLYFTCVALISRSPIMRSAKINLILTLLN